MLWFFMIRRVEKKIVEVAIDDAVRAIEMLGKDLTKSLNRKGIAWKIGDP